MKIIMSAYACQPKAGSEEGVGWNWAVQVAKRGHEVHVVTQKPSQAAIEAELSKKEIKGLSFHYIEAYKSLRNLSSFWGWQYYAWQITLAFKARQLHKQINFDLAHHLTYCTDWMPSGLAVLEIPFIWGPIGGSTHQLPPNIELNLSEEAKRFEKKREIMQWCFKSFDPFLKLTMAKASKILPYTYEALPGIPYKYQNKATPIVHIGVDNSDLPANYQRNSEIKDVNEGLRILTGGRIVHWKGFDLLFEGFKLHLQNTKTNSKIVFTTKSGGKDESAIEELAKSCGLEKDIEFLGNLPTRNDVFLAMKTCHLYALPTLRDGPPTAILEAMFAGLPILCLDLGATHELVPNEAGFKIPVHNREQIIKDISLAITQANENRLALHKMGDIGQKYALENHSWDKIGEEIQSIYQDLIFIDSNKQDSETILK